MAVNIRSKIDSRGGLTATLPREGIDIGAMPDFWADLNALQSRLKPRAPAQEWAMRRPTAQLGSLQQAGPAALGRVPLFGVPTNVGSGATFFQPWTPGMSLGVGQRPEAIGYLPYGYEPPRLPESSYFV